MIVEPSEPDIPPAQARDRELVEAHCSGDHQAFATIVSLHYRELLAQAERRLGRGGDADDAVQETFERAFRALCRFGERGEYRLGAWLSRILSNVCHDHSGREAVERGLPDRVAAREVPTADAFESVSDPVVLRAVRDAIDALPSSQRDTFLLKEMDGLSYLQVAAHLDITEDNARARVHRARSALRRSLALTRAALGSLVAIPIGLRSLFRRGSVPPTVPGSELTTAPSTASTLATQVAVSPVGQAVVALAPSGGLRGSIVAGLAGLAVTGALAVPAVTSGSSSQPTPSGDRTEQGVGTPVPVPTSIITPAPPTETSVPAPTETSAPSVAPSVVPPTAPAAAQEERADWWNIDTYKAALADDDKDADADAAPSTAAAPAVAPVPTCGPADALVSAAGATRVVSTLDLPRSVRLDPTDRGYEFSYGTNLAATGEELTVTGEVCRDGGSVSLDLRLVTAAGTVHLTGRSVYDQDGVWLFRGSAVHEGDGPAFDWETSRFVAKFQTAQLTGETLVGELSVAFQADAAHGEDQGQGEPILINGSHDDTPADAHPPSGTGTGTGDDGATGPSGDPGGSGSGDGSAVPPSTTTTTTAPPVQGGAAA